MRRSFGMARLPALPPRLGVLSALGQTATSRDVAVMSADRFSNRPFRVKRFQTNHHYSSVDVAHGLVLLFGIGTRPFHHGSRRRGGTIYRAALL